YGYLNGEYQILVHVSGFYETVWQSISATNFSERVDARYANTNHGAYGLAFNINGSPGSYSYYIFIVAPFSQQFAIFEKLNGSWTASPLVPWTTSSAINPSQATNHLTVIRNGPSIQGLVNGTQVTSVGNSDVLSGNVGLFNETFT